MTWSIVLLLFLCTLGCKDDAAFAAEHRTRIDTTFLSIKKVMKEEIDSLCLINNEDFYQSVYDSIMDARIAEIESHLEAVKAKNLGQ